MATKKTNSTKNTSPDHDLSIFDVKVSESLLAQAVYVYQSNSHQNTSKTKSRGEIRASKRKIHKQKGTGKARHGALSAPIFVGGGIAHGPVGVRPNRKKLTKKMKNKALLGALSLLHQNQALSVITSLPATSAKHTTRKTLKTQKVVEMVGDSPVTLVQHQSTPALLKAFSNLKSVKILPADQLNAYQVLQSKKLIFTPQALELIKTRLKTYL